MNKNKNISIILLPNEFCIYTVKNFKLYYKTSLIPLSFNVSNHKILTTNSVMYGNYDSFISCMYANKSSLLNPKTNR
jgi:hypothetical protein